MLTDLGRPPSAFGHTYEQPVLWLETTHGSGDFNPTPIPFRQVRITFGALDGLAGAQIDVMIGRPTDVEWVGSAGDPGARDWQIYEYRGQSQAGVYRNPEDIFSYGRRLQIRTEREQYDWCLFEGFIDRTARGWDRDGQDVRWVTVYCSSTIVAADRLIEQFLAGQWRRSRFATNKLYTELDPSPLETNQCVPVTAMPCVFNPGGLPNCHPTPLAFPADNDSFGTTEVYVFTDVDFARRNQPADPWTVARILRYIQWAALQPGPVPPQNEADNAYDRRRFSNTGGLNASNVRWTIYNLAHTQRSHQPSQPLDVNEIGPNLSRLIEPYLSRTDQGDPGDLQAQAMLRRPEISIEGMSVLEAFTMVCDTAGVLFHVEHDVDPNGDVWTYLRFTVRGDRGRHGGMFEGEDEGAHEIPPSGGTTTPAGGVTITENNPFGFRIVNRLATSRGVFLYASSDRGPPPAGATPAEVYRNAFKNDSAFKGQLTQTAADQRRRVLLGGDATEYEVTVPLLPGWAPDENWDIRWGGTDEPATEEAAIEQADEFWPTDGFANKYGPTNVPFDTKNVGRWWVLNEDGDFAPTQYSRQHGVWHDETEPPAPGEPIPPSKWLPFKWRSDGGIFELVNRGDDYWSTRRRRFLPLIAKADGRWLKPILQIAFDGGGAGDVWYDALPLNITWELNEDRCAIYITTQDLRGIIPPGGLLNYVEAYIRNKLRVRITANVHGDDALRGWSNEPSGTAGGVYFTDYVSRLGQMPRRLRFKPDGSNNPASSTDMLIPAFMATVRGDNDNRQSEAERVATRMLDEFSCPRVSGLVTIPWLWRNRYGPQGIVGYRIGDEVLGLKTQDNATVWLFGEGRVPSESFPRIIGLIYTISEADMSTTLQLEDHSLGLNDLVGSPDVIGADRYAAARGVVPT